MSKARFAHHLVHANLCGKVVQRVKVYCRGSKPKCLADVAEQIFSGLPSHAVDHVYVCIREHLGQHLCGITYLLHGGIEREQSAVQSGKRLCPETNSIHTNALHRFELLTRNTLYFQFKRELDELSRVKMCVQSVSERFDLEGTQQRRCSSPDEHNVYFGPAKEVALEFYFAQ